MPTVIRSSRSRRQVEEDNIEEQESTQRSRTEDVEEAEEEEQPQRSKRRSTTRVADTKRVKVEKSKKRREEIITADGEEDEEQEEEKSRDQKPVIDVANFVDQPLPKEDARKISDLKGEWDGYISSFRNTVMGVGVNVAEEMAEVHKGEANEEARRELDKIDIMMRELLDAQAEMKAHSDTLEDIVNSINSGEEIDNVLDRYKIGVEDRQEAWANKTSRQKYAKDEDYTEFKQKIFEVQNGAGEAMPPMTEFIPKEDGDESDDDDIEVGGVSQKYTCPLTLTTLVDPMSSSVCTHTFSRASIVDYFKSNRSIRKKCPATGCNKQFMLMDLKPNKKVADAVKAHLLRERRRQAEADSDDDAGEVIE